MDPLSIAASIIAVLSASGKTLEGVERIRELHHRDRHFRDLSETIRGLQILFRSAHFALDHILKQHGELSITQVYLRDIETFCKEIQSTIEEVDTLVGNVRPKKDASKPAKLLWLYRKPELIRLKERLRDTLVSVATSFNLILSVQSSVNLRLLHSQLVLSPSSSTQICEQTPCPGEHNFHVEKDIRIKQSPIDSAYSITDKNVHDALVLSSSSSFEPFTNGHTGCKKHCKCKCHSVTRFSSPTWIKYILGSFKIQGNGSVFLKRRPCDKDYCQASDPLYVQMSYTAPTWTLFKDLVICMQADPSFSISSPREISSNAKIWSLIELGNISELKELFSERRASPYDVTLDGTSLIKYALIHGQIEVYSLLLSLKANPYFHDHFGVMAIQPGIDRFLCGLHLARDNIPRGQSPFEFYITDEDLEQQCFTELHLIILKRVPKDLETALENDRADIDSSDANGRTPLLWSASRGDTMSIILLLKYGANINKTDNELFTPLARAAQGGHLAAVEILLTAKAIIQTKNIWGQEAIHLASEHKLNGSRVLEELLEWGADVNAYSKAGTPLHSAANRGSVETLKILIAQGADVDAIGGNGETAAMMALYCWNEAAFICLTEAGARLDIVDKRGYNIIQLAVWSASINAWALVIQRAESGALGHIDLDALHNGHDIEQCFNECRGLWYLGERPEPALERAEFNRMLDACSMLHNNQPCLHELY